MTAVDATRVVTLPWLLGRAAALTWFELPMAIAVCAIWLTSLAPLAVAILSGQWRLIAIGSVPAALLLTGMSRFAAVVLRGERPRLRDVFTVDPVLAVTVSASGTLAGVLLSSWLQPLGYVLAAVLVVLAPYALAYGAVRNRRGLTAWRGALILVAYRPSWALTVLAVSLLGAFVVIATVGALGLLFPAILAVFTAGVISRLLETIDERGGP